MSPLNIIIAIFVLVSLFNSFRKGAARRAEQMEALRSAAERVQAMPAASPPSGAAAAASPLSYRAMPQALPRLHEPYVSILAVAPSEDVLSVPVPHEDVVGVPIPTGGSILGATFEGIGTEGELEDAHAAHVPSAIPADYAYAAPPQITLAEMRRAVVLSELLGPPRALRRAGRAAH